MWLITYLEWIWSATIIYHTLFQHHTISHHQSTTKIFQINAGLKRSKIFFYEHRKLVHQ